MLTWGELTSTCHWHILSRKKGCLWANLSKSFDLLKLCSSLFCLSRLLWSFSHIGFAHSCQVYSLVYCIFCYYSKRDFSLLLNLLGLTLLWLSKATYYISFGNKIILLQWNNFNLSLAQMDIQDWVDIKFMYHTWKGKIEHLSTLQVSSFFWGPFRSFLCQNDT